VEPSQFRGLARRLGRPPYSLALFAELPLIVAGFYAWTILVAHRWAMQDFETVRRAGHDVIHGTSPYPPPDPAVIAHATRLVYPPLIAYLFAPFALVPYHVAAAVYLLLSVAAIPLTLRVLRIRDWRCYGVAFLWYPAVAGLGVGAIGPFLALLVALSWRYRDRALVVAPLLALTITLKLFLWPLAVWMLATRRWRAGVLTGLLTVAAFFLPFIPLGMHVLRSYPSVLRTLDEVFGPISFSTTAFLRAAGLSSTAASVAVVALGALLVFGILWLGRRRDGDRIALTAAVAAALLLSPIVWIHYFVLLLVPVALARPRLTGLWFLPTVLWSAHALESDGQLWRLAIVFGTTAAVAWVCLTGERRLQRASSAERKAARAVPTG
jgi:glycosyl transferase family 87